MVSAFLGEALKKGVDLIGPIILREVAKPRFRRFVEEKAQDVATEIARRVTTKKSKKFIMRRGRQQFQCRRVK